MRLDGWTARRLDGWWIVLLLSLVCHAPFLAAQVSPGPLARVHRELEGSLECTKCHGGGSITMEARCLACHGDIGWLAQRGRGVHGAPQIRSAKCASCHPDHAGVDFALIQWPDGNREKFAHQRAGWTLEQSHARVDCVECHKPAYRSSPSARLAGSGRSNWTGLERSCASCHEDAHQGGFGERCQTCHDSGEWSLTPNFKHDTTDYPLTGKHVEVKCTECHTAPNQRLAYLSCANCHQDVHRGSFGASCTTCHTTTSFKDASGGRFDHRRTSFPLKGRHAAVACRSCHRDFTSERGRHPIATSCAACHSPDPHAGTTTLQGKPADCSGCHDERGFSPSTYSRERHQATAYPLEGKHRVVECGACHGKDRSPGAAAKLGKSLVVLRPAFAVCTACHADQHQGRYAGNRCTECHDLSAFRPSFVTTAVHDRFGFKLLGAHRATPCFGCHKEMTTFAADSTCSSCHQSVHGNQFENRRCDACHSEDSFKPATRFDHEKDASFTLGKGHGKLACSACHKMEGTPPQVVYRPLSGKCESCH